MTRPELRGEMADKNKAPKDQPPPPPKDKSPFKDPTMQKFRGSYNGPKKNV
jgi:hypothetical protein